MTDAPSDAIPSDPADQKERAAVAALSRVRSGTVIGLGSGSTAAQFIAALGRALKSGALSDVRGIPTSEESGRLAADAGVPVVTFADAPDGCDVTVDGADEVGPGLQLIKGLGGALLREKMVAQNSRRLVIIADGSKAVDRLGTKSPLPVEVVPFGRAATERFLRSLGCDPVLRAGRDGSPYVTDNAAYIYDCHFPGGIDDPAAIDAEMKARAGVLVTGLFLGLADEAILAGAGGVRVLRRE